MAKAKKKSKNAVLTTNIKAPIKEQDDATLFLRLSKLNAELEALDAKRREMEKELPALQKEVSQRLGLSLTAAPSKAPAAPKKNGAVKSGKDTNWAELRNSLPSKMEKGTWYTGAQVRELVGFNGEGNFNQSVLNALLDSSIKKRGKGKATEWTLK